MAAPKKRTAEGWRGITPQKSAPGNNELARGESPRPARLLQALGPVPLFQNGVAGRPLAGHCFRQLQIMVAQAPARAAWRSI
jgi:hypothetical protein